MDVVRSYYKYENGNMKREVIGNYQAEYWNYTEEGYLMFSGVWFFRRIICSYIEWSRGTYRITGTAIG